MHFILFLVKDKMNPTSFRGDLVLASVVLDLEFLKARLSQVEIRLMRITTCFALVGEEHLLRQNSSYYPDVKCSQSAGE